MISYEGLLQTLRDEKSISMPGRFVSRTAGPHDIQFQPYRGQQTQRGSDQDDF